MLSLATWNEKFMGNERDNACCAVVIVDAQAWDCYPVVVGELIYCKYDWTRSIDNDSDGAFDKHDQIGNVKVYHRDERITGAFLNHPVCISRWDIINFVEHFLFINPTVKQSINLSLPDNREKTKWFEPPSVYIHNKEKAGERKSDWLIININFSMAAVLLYPTDFWWIWSMEADNHYL